MPELPEVERARRVLERVAVGRTIVRVDVDDDRIVYDGVAPRTFAARLRGRRVEAARRRGKHLWLELDRRPWPLLHLGMTGHVLSPSVAPLRLASSPAKEEERWPPRFTKLRLRLDDGGDVAFTNKRRLGRLRLRDDPPHEPPISALGFDPLVDPPSAADFLRLVRRRRGVVKALLLDQSFAAGVGNWIADEVLYRARVDPRRSADTLSDDEVRRLRRALLEVVRRASAVDADKRRFPATWLFHRRWGRDAEARTHDGHRVEFLTLGGRTTAWVPAVQGGPRAEQG
ncbi:MAG: DNA-formamidopyrimidine glycosylase family protein [Planctomycetota bacterium JB042]